MIKAVLFIILCILISSCNKRMYYAYENKEEGSYCTMEFNKKETIYRAISTKHYLFTYPSKYYVHIVSSNDFDYEDPEINKGAFMKYIKLEDTIPLTTWCQFSSNFNGDDTFLFYGKTATQDSLELTKDTELLNNEPCIIEHKMTWFPPYIKKIKKIDYDKFKIPYKKKFLKTMNEGIYYAN